MWFTFSAAAAELLHTSHGVTARATAFSPTYGTLTDLPVSGGSVTVDATSQVRRVASIEVADPSRWPATPLSLLSPLGSEMLVEHGVVFPGGAIEWTPLGRFTIAAAEREKPRSANPFSVSLEDRSAKVAEAKFLAPTQLRTGYSAVAEITRLVQEVLPAVEVLDLTADATVAPKIEIDKERWATVEKLAESIAAEVYFDPIGRLVVRKVPTFDQSPGWSVLHGQNGTLVSVKEKISRENVYNAFVVSGSRSDGTTPVSATVYDTDPRSATVWGGAFGQKPRTYTSALLTTQAQCTAVGQALLERSKGASSSISLSAIVNPALEGSEVILVRDDDGPAVHIADSFNVPLGAEETQDITTRSLQLPEES